MLRHPYHHNIGLRSSLSNVKSSPLLSFSSTVDVSSLFASLSPPTWTTGRDGIHKGERTHSHSPIQSFGCPSIPSGFWLFSPHVHVHMVMFFYHLLNKNGCIRKKSSCLTVIFSLAPSFSNIILHTKNVQSVVHLLWFCICCFRAISILNLFSATVNSETSALSLLVDFLFNRWHIASVPHFVVKFMNISFF